MKFRSIVCCVFLFLTSILFSANKPIIDWYCWRSPETPLSHERAEFILMNSGKHSDVLLLSDWTLLDVDYKRAEGYKKIIGLIAEPSRSMNRLLDPTNHLRDPKFGPSSWIETNLHKFDLILTFNKYLLDKYPQKCKFIHPVGFGTLSKHAVHPKSKLCSHMVSSQKVSEGHRLRWEVDQQYHSFFDGIKDGNSPWVEWKDGWLNDFCFSVVIENSRESHYFSEKLVECLRAGTIPIYWGCPTVGEFFDQEGIIVFNNVEELGPILESLSMQEYERRLPAVYRNFELASKYPQYRLTPCIRYDTHIVVDPENTWKYSIEQPDVFDCIWPYVKDWFNR